MKSRIFRISSYLAMFSASLSLAMLFSGCSHDMLYGTRLPLSETFHPLDRNPPPLQGKIIDHRYYAPNNVFSCQADDFGEGRYISQDTLFENHACVAFYSSTANFKKAEILFSPALENKRFDREDLHDAFTNFGIGILKDVDNAQDIEILQEEMIEDNMLFVAVSIGKMSVLRICGQYPSSTRGYLVFKNKDKLILLSNQEVTLPGNKHTPQEHVEKLKQDILEFSKTFEYGSSAAQPVEKTKPQGVTHIMW